MRRIVIAMVLAVIGCGSGGGSDPPTGTGGAAGVGGTAGTGGSGGDEPHDVLADTAWAAPIQGRTCEFGFLFGDVGDYTFLVACLLESGAQAAYVETGDYNIAGDQLTTVATEASCPRELVQVVLVASFAVSGSTLTLFNPSGLTNFAKIVPGAPSAGTITIGCFDDQLYFTPYPITPL